MVYRILLCDGNPHFLNELVPCLNEIVVKRNDFTFEIDCAMQRGVTASAIKNKTYDLITLDVCYTNTGNTPITVYENLCLSISDSMYGVELYLNEIKNKIETEVTKVLVVSSMNVETLRRNFNFAPTLDFFARGQSNQFSSQII